jgi:hypothetical protein
MYDRGGLSVDDKPRHYDCATALGESCAEAEARWQKLVEERRDQAVELLDTLGVAIDGAPTYAQVYERVLEAVRELQAKAAGFDAALATLARGKEWMYRHPNHDAVTMSGEQAAELQDKARKWDAMDAGMGECVRLTDATWAGGINSVVRGAPDRGVIESGPGLAARYSDATKPGREPEPITCDLSGDWD